MKTFVLGLVLGLSSVYGNEAMASEVKLSLQQRVSVLSLFSKATIVRSDSGLRRSDVTKTLSCALGDASALSGQTCQIKSLSCQAQTQSKARCTLVITSTLQDPDYPQNSLESDQVFEASILNLRTVPLLENGAISVSTSG